VLLRHVRFTSSPTEGTMTTNNELNRSWQERLAIAARQNEALFSPDIEIAGPAISNALAMMTRGRAIDFDNLVRNPSSVVLAAAIDVYDEALGHLHEYRRKRFAEALGDNLGGRVQ
jgi:hypothetical protein